MFTDETVDAGRAGTPGPHAARVGGTSTAASSRTGSAQGTYLRWVYEQAVAALPPGITVQHHRAPRPARHRPARRPSARLAGGPRRNRSPPTSSSSRSVTSTPNSTTSSVELTAYADRHGLVHLPPDFTADSDLTALRAGEPVLVRGFGLAFVDLMVLLTEGRGGRYERRTTYLPVRQGARAAHRIAARCPVPLQDRLRLAGRTAAAAALLRAGPRSTSCCARPDGFDFRRDVWPLVDKELGFAHYHRLFAAHPERTTVAWTDFEEKYAAADPGSRAARPGRRRRARPGRPARPRPRSTTRWTGCATLVRRTPGRAARVHQRRPRPPPRPRAQRGPRRLPRTALRLRAVDAAR